MAITSRLDGYTLSTPQVQPGDILQLDLFWRTDAPLSERYKVFVHVLDQNGQIVAQTDREPGGGQKPTTNWETNEQIVDRYGVLIPEDTPPGTYAIEIGLYDFDGTRLPVDARRRCADCDAASRCSEGRNNNVCDWLVARGTIRRCCSALI